MSNLDAGSVVGRLIDLTVILALIILLARQMRDARNGKRRREDNDFPPL